MNRTTWYATCNVNFTYCGYIKTNLKDYILYDSKETAEFLKHKHNLLVQSVCNGFLFNERLYVLSRVLEKI